MPSKRWLYVAGLLALPPTYASAYSSEPSLAIIAILLICVVIGMGWYCFALIRHNKKLSQHSVHLHNVMQYTNDYIAILDKNKKAIYLNPSFSALGITTLADSPNLLQFYTDQHSGQLLLPQLQHANWEGEAWLQTTEIETRQAFALRIAQIATDDKRFLLIAKNIHADKIVQRQTERAYSRDSQTGLYSKHMLHEFLQSFVNSTSDTHPHFALVMVKFSQLLSVNNNKPNAALQDVIVELSAHLPQLCEKSFIVARYSHDIVAIAIPPHQCNNALEVKLNRLSHKLIDLPLKLVSPDQSNSVQISIGISLYPEDATSSNELILAATNALLNAGRRGHHHLAFANPNIQQRTPEYSALETELHKAVTQGEFDLYFQPRVSIASNRVIGYEALLRWHSPKRGILLPQHFMQIADETGLITQLDILTFKKCCQQLKQWQQNGLVRGRLSLNISSLSIQQIDFVSILARQLKTYELSGEQFELELHEDTFLNDDSATLSTLQQLAALGFHLTLDNFGVGVSSLTMLQKYPLHNIKIAPSYVKDMEHNEQQRNITACIIRLASYLQLDAIATGIENEMQAYLLHVMGCDIFQGYLFSKALPASEIPALLAKENKLVRKEVG